MDEIYLSVVIPAYNEEKRIVGTLNIIFEYLSKQNYNSEIIIVDDGSEDQTLKILKNKEKDCSVNFHIISYGDNRGKGYAIKSGMLKAQGRYVLFSDADNATPFGEIAKLLSQISDYDIVIGSRYITGGEIKKKQNLFRRFISRGGNLLFWLILGLKYKDTRCGFKLFRNQVAQNLFSLQKLERWGFDTEILVIAKRYKYRVAEVPVVWYDKSRSQINPFCDSIKSLWEILQIKWNLVREKYNKNKS